jgi:succinyl-diaminopimelate desuccinylase
MNKSVMSRLSIENKFMEKVNSLSKDLLKLTRELVRIPSENPPGDESSVSEFVRNTLETLGLDVEFIEPEPKRVNTLGITGIMIQFLLEV